MTQGLKLLTQLVVEFAPVVASLINNQPENIVDASNYQISKIIKEFAQFISNPPPAEKKSVTSAETAFQYQLAVHQREIQLEVINQEREIIFKLPEVDKILDNWPLRLYPTQILDSHAHTDRQPLKVLIAPLQVKVDQFNILQDRTSAIELVVAEGLRKFMTEHYSLHSKIRPTEFLAGAWDSQRFYDEASVKALFQTT